MQKPFNQNPRLQDLLQNILVALKENKYLLLPDIHYRGYWLALSIA